MKIAKATVKSVREQGMMRTLGDAVEAEISLHVVAMELGCVSVVKVVGWLRLCLLTAFFKFVEFGPTILLVIGFGDVFGLQKRFNISGMLRGMCPLFKSHIPAIHSRKQHHAVIHNV